MPGVLLGFGLTAPAWIGVLLAAGAVGVGAVSWRVDRAEAARQRTGRLAG